MCGRFGTISPTRTFAQLLDLRDEHPQLAQRYNQPPGQWILAGAADPLGRSQPAMQTLYWGLIPSWAKKASLAQINARSETAATKPFFRKAFHKRRCVIAADFWYEWQRTEHGKRPFVLRPADGAPFFFAGLWSLARSLPADHPASDCRTTAILTTKARDSITHIHPRMPVTLTAEGARAWLSSGEDTGDLQGRLVAGQHGKYEAWPVSARVNNAGNEGRDLLEAVSLG